MVPFPLLISLNTKMSLEAGGEQGRGALFPILALPAVALALVQGHCGPVCKSRWGGRAAGGLAPSAAIAGGL